MKQKYFSLYNTFKYSISYIKIRFEKDRVTMILFYFVPLYQNYIKAFSTLIDK